MLSCKAQPRRAELLRRARIRDGDTRLLRASMLPLPLVTVYLLLPLVASYIHYSVHLILDRGVFRPDPPALIYSPRLIIGTGVIPLSILVQYT